MTTTLIFDCIVTLLTVLFTHLAIRVMRKRERLYADDPTVESLSQQRQILSVAAYLSFMLAPVLAQTTRMTGPFVGLSEAFVFTNGLVLVLFNATFIAALLRRTNTHFNNIGVH
ncbi:MAG TPA: hypothetical protein V6C81_10865 [Planktothrix sp.]|jgi:hypothetical protein